MVMHGEVLGDHHWFVGGIHRSRVMKILVEEAQGVFIAPDWASDWLSMVLKLAKKKLFFDVGTKVFELEYCEVGPVRWGVHAFLLVKEIAKETEIVSESMRGRQRREKKL